MSRTFCTCLGIGRIFTTDEARLDSSSQRGSAGNGGDITIKASGNIDIAEKSTLLLTRTYGTGDAGNVFLQGKAISLTDGAHIDADTSSTGKGGNITINATGNVDIAGKYTGLSTETHGTGNCGTIMVTASNLLLEEGGTITASTAGAGHGGTIIVKADELHATGGCMGAITDGEGDGGGYFA